MYRKFARLMSFATLVARYADGGAQPPAEPPAAAVSPAAPLAAAPAAPPAAVPPAQPAAPPEKSYTDADIETAKAAAVEAYKLHLTEAQDFDKMTAEEKVAHLQKQMADEKLSGYTTAALVKAALPPELLPFVKGASETETDERVKSFKAVYDKGVQAGVEARFKTNGYTPKGSAVTAGDTEKSKRPRGVSIK